MTRAHSLRRHTALIVCGGPGGYLSAFGAMVWFVNQSRTPVSPDIANSTEMLHIVSSISAVW